METVHLLEKEFQKRGYKDVSINLWNKTYLFVNVKGKPSFYFDLCHRYNKKCGCQIHSRMVLSPGFFNDMRFIAAFVWRYRNKLQTELSNAECFA